MENEKGTGQIDPKGISNAPPTPVSPDNPTSANTKTTRDDTQDKKIQSLEEDIRKAEKWMILFTGLMAFFALCSVIVGVFQLIVTKGQLHEMQTTSVDTHDLAVQAKAQADSSRVIAESGKLQAENTKVIAESAKKQATAAIGQVAKLDAGVKETHSLAQASKDLVASSRDNFLGDQRPYVWIKPQKNPTPEQGKPFYWNIDFVNHGRSPAVNLVSCAFASLGNFGDINNVHEPTLVSCGIDNRVPNHSSSVVPPGDKGFLTVGLERPMTKSDVDQINAGMHFGITGVIEYDDLYGHSYRSEFCLILLGGGGLAMCPKYNYMRQIK